jgi:hypothetical protein
LRSRKLCRHCRTVHIFMKTGRFIIMLTKALHLSLSWARLLQSIRSQSISLRSILILSIQLRLGLPGGSFFLAFPPISYSLLLISHSCYMHCPSRPPWLDHLNHSWGWLQFMKPVLCILLHPSVIGSLFVSNILNKLFSDTFSICSFLNVRDQVSHPYTTTGKITVTYI